jgi:Protein of unknown function (DUF2798)
MAPVMSNPRSLRFWLLPPLLAAATLAVALAATLLFQALKAGTPESLMLAWLLAFVVVLPLALLVLPLASRLAAALRRNAIVPSAGVKIPSLGQ